MLDAREMGAPMRTEVYGLFAACIPQAGRDRFAKLPLRKRQGLVPDFMCDMQWAGKGPCVDQLLELKTLHHTANTYPPNAGRRCAAVERRAVQVPNEDARKAQNMDRQYCGTGSEQAGPVEAKLRSFGDIRALVFSTWGEASPDVHALLRALVDVGMHRHFRSMRVKDANEARGPLMWLLRRRWGMCTVRESARLLLARLELVGRGAEQAVGYRLPPGLWRMSG